MKPTHEHAVPRLNCGAAEADPSSAPRSVLEVT
jgi:hypothetical protein